MEKELTYKDSGVDIEAGYEAVGRIKGHCRSTFRPEVIGEIGSFGALCALPGRYKDPVLVSGTDGVGTKLKLAFEMDRHDTVGIDLVAYCVNDIICQGAEPLFFLDYLAVGKLDPAQVESLVAGIAQGCREAGAALIGGETAEMPGFYPPGEYDMAGFAVGVVEREEILDGSRVRAGDAILGLASTGLQSSGFSLVRKIVAGRDLNEFIPELQKTLGEELLTPTAVYVKPIRRLIEELEIRGIANVSGGGLPENLPRSLAPGTRAQVQWGSWPVPPIFPLLQKWGNVSSREMLRTFNLGVGMAIYLPAEQVQRAQEILGELGIASYQIGRVVAGEPGLDIEGE